MCDQRRQTAAATRSGLRAASGAAMAQRPRPPEQVLAFRGEIEAQCRGSLHPHILVWLVCGHLGVLSQLTEMLRTNKLELQQRLKEFMQLAVASFEAISHASVQAAPRCLGTTALDKPVKVKEVARNLCKYGFVAGIAREDSRTRREPGFGF